MGNVLKLLVGVGIGAGCYLYLNQTASGRALKAQAEAFATTFVDTVREGYRGRTEELQRAIADHH